MSSPDKEIKEMVRQRYGLTALGKSDGCCGAPGDEKQLQDFGRMLDYSSSDLAKGAGESNLGLGCGNPLSVAGLKPGMTVLDLGSGAGFDAFLAAEKVGPSGMVIGVDMTPEMIAKAEKNARKMNVANVEFRLGEIEKLPLEDDSVDVAISNCVINLSSDKKAAFAEIFRVLKPGGRIAVSDVLRQAEIPDAVMKDPSAYCG